MDTSLQQLSRHARAQPPAMPEPEVRRAGARQDHHSVHALGHARHALHRIEPILAALLGQVMATNACSINLSLQVARGEQTIDFDSLALEMQELTDASSDALAQISSLIAEVSHALGTLTETLAEVPHAPSPAGPSLDTVHKGALDEERVLA